MTATECGETPEFGQSIARYASWTSASPWSDYMVELAVVVTGVRRLRKRLECRLAKELAVVCAIGCD
jgi:Uri superfamily endonuclease